VNLLRVVYQIAVDWEIIFKGIFSKGDQIFETQAYLILVMTFCGDFKICARGYTRLTSLDRILREHQALSYIQIPYPIYLPEKAV